MKKITLILLIFSTLFSCNNEEKLNKKIIELEAKNKILNDSFNKMMQNAIEQSKVKLTSETNDNSIKINGQWLQFSKLPKYNLYKIDNLKQGKKLIAENLTDPDFQFDFKPMSKSDSIVLVIAEFDINGFKIIKYGRLNFRVNN